ncbi:DUF6481 family protein [Azospirillum doebereinerae]|uniref:Uncharacterized protein n=1 Tax=Azospirillum doebereinerae TaxID=92933 RepID=A0A433JEX6_9PROT|nr:DUF6481 family protein [Azospirillum doebereinerae]MCG5239092.1 DUF6481 family protein [Azospirillum doebereinerae]RUQ75709.1 hypothetical protein EJ913_00910 [Azospirillum doebereinerae]
MSGFKEVGFGDRRSAATAAKKAQVEKYRESSVLDDAAFAARQSELLAVRVAREARAAERKADREAAEAKAAAEKLAAEAQAVQDAAARAANDQSLLAEQKAARDARYAARKARK